MCSYRLSDGSPLPLAPYLVILALLSLYLLFYLALDSDVRCLF